MKCHLEFRQALNESAMSSGVLDAKTSSQGKPHLENLISSFERVGNVIWSFGRENLIPSFEKSVSWSRMLATYEFGIIWNPWDYA